MLARGAAAILVTSRHNGNGKKKRDSLTLTAVSANEKEMLVVPVPFHSGGTDMEPLALIHPADVEPGYSGGRRPPAFPP